MSTTQEKLLKMKNDNTKMLDHIAKNMGDDKLIVIIIRTHQMEGDTITQPLVITNLSPNIDNFGVIHTMLRHLNHVVNSFMDKVTKVSISEYNVAIQGKDIVMEKPID